MGRRRRCQGRGPGHRGRGRRWRRGRQDPLLGDLSRAVLAHRPAHGGPDRVIVDLPEVAFHLPPETGRKREGLIASYRYGLFAPGRSRVVMDLAQPAVVSASMSTRTQPGGRAPRRRAVEGRPGGFPTRRGRERGRRGARPEAAVVEESGTRARDRARSGPWRHRSRRRGRAGGMFEKDIVLAFAQLLKKKLDGTVATGS